MRKFTFNKSQCLLRLLYGYLMVIVRASLKVVPNGSSHFLGFFSWDYCMRPFPIAFVLQV